MNSRLKQIEKRLTQYGADRCLHYQIREYRYENGVEKLIEPPAICPKCGLPPSLPIAYLPQKMTQEEWERSYSSKQ